MKEVVFLLLRSIMEAAAIMLGLASILAAFTGIALYGISLL